jgi:hypothetical protein
MCLLALLVVNLKHIVGSTPKDVHVALCFTNDLSMINDIELDDRASLVSRLLDCMKSPTAESMHDNETRKPRNLET